MLLGLIPQLPPDAPGDTALTTLIGLFEWLGAGWGPTLSYMWWAQEKGVGMHSTKCQVKAGLTHQTSHGFENG